MKNSVIQTGENLHLKKTIIFQFEDGKQATFRLDKDCDSMQAFLNRVEKYHELEKENKRLKEQLQEANAIITGEIHLVRRKDNEYVCESPEIINYKKKWSVK